MYVFNSQCADTQVTTEHADSAKGSCMASASDMLVLETSVCVLLCMLTNVPEAKGSSNRLEKDQNHRLNSLSTCFVKSERLPHILVQKCRPNRTQGMSDLVAISGDFERQHCCWDRIIYLHNVLYIEKSLEDLKDRLDSRGNALYWN